MLGGGEDLGGLIGFGVILGVELDLSQLDGVHAGLHQLQLEEGLEDVADTLELARELGQAAGASQILQQALGLFWCWRIHRITSTSLG